MVEAVKLLARTEAITDKSRYAHVRKWFVGQFPDFREVKVFMMDPTSATAVVPAPEMAA